MRILSKLRADPDRVGDVIGGAALIGMLVAGLWVAFGAGLPTGGDLLLEAVR